MGTGGGSWTGFTPFAANSSRSCNAAIAVSLFRHGLRTLAVSFILDFCCSSFPCRSCKASKCWESGALGAANSAFFLGRPSGFPLSFLGFLTPSALDLGSRPLGFGAGSRPSAYFVGGLPRLLGIGTTPLFPGRGAAAGASLSVIGTITNPPALPS
nr:hypothetical protein Iba_chr03aCG21910 [Ipomoea batatas]